MKIRRSPLFFLCSALVLASTFAIGASAPHAQGLPVTRPERVGLAGDRLNRIRGALSASTRLCVRRRKASSKATTPR